MVDPTSGGTGLALDFIVCERDYRCVLIMPETMSVERRTMLLALGAGVLLTPNEKKCFEVGFLVHFVTLDCIKRRRKQTRGILGPLSIFHELTIHRGSNDHACMLDGHEQFPFRVLHSKSSGEFSVQLADITSVGNGLVGEILQTAPPSHGFFGRVAVFGFGNRFGVGL